MALWGVDDQDVIFVAGDVSEDRVCREDEATAILANSQVRKYLH